jgi:hypothetical protein
MSNDHLTKLSKKTDAFLLNRIPLYEGDTVEFCVHFSFAYKWFCFSWSDYPLSHQTRMIVENSQLT